MEPSELIVVVLIPLVLSLTVHEFAHAQVAWWLGDDTADRQGRRTLNPVPHIDIFGTLIFPAIAIMSPGLFLFGWAKPVPVNPSRFRPNVNPTRGMMYVAAAGPISNLILAVLSAAAIKVVVTVNPEILKDTGLFQLILIRLNIALFLFNLLPVFPLDGSRVLRGILPPSKTRWLDAMESNRTIMMLAFLGVIWFAGVLLWLPIMTIESAILTIFGLS